MRERSGREMTGGRSVLRIPAVRERRSARPWVLCGRYDVGVLIGSGASARVYRGRDIHDERPVAIKVLRPELAGNRLFRSSFRRETRSSAVLCHPAIASIYDTGWDEVDTGATGRVRVPFIVMEYVAGQSLRELLRTRAITVGEALHYELGVLSALEDAHRAGIVHRDIKPANVMIDDQGAVKVVDFGISRIVGRPDATLTRAQALLGTPSYLSPEQARGEAVDTRSDLYSAGCLLFELLSGRPPFVGDDPVSVLYRHVHEEPARVSTANPALDAVIARSLAKSPGERFQDARSFSDALLAAAIGAIAADRR